MLNTQHCLAVLTLLCLTGSISTVRAQTYTPSNRTPVADTTLGTQVSGSNKDFTITGGAAKGQTLFHSFTDFSIPTNGQANFTNPAGNRDIITRVTGSSFSDINGLINSNGANFFLINPNGITFGTGAQLNVGKTFMGSTANGINLVDPSGRILTFGTNPTGDTPLLSVAPNVLFNVASLNMGNSNGQISNFGTLQTSNPDRYIGLIGGKIDINGGQITAPGGRVELGAISAPGTVIVSADGTNFGMKLPANTTRGDVSLTNKAKVDITGLGGGEIFIDARNIDILGASFLTSGIPAKLGSANTVAGDIKLNTTGQVTVADRSRIENLVDDNGIGDAGNITLETRSLSVQNRGSIYSKSSGTGKIGNIKITAKDDISILNSSDISSLKEFSYVGGNSNGGKINISGKSLLIKNKSAIESNNYLSRDAGDITINVSDAIDLDNSEIYSNINKSGGKAGDIKLDANSISLRNNSEISSTTFLGGRPGIIKINADIFVNLSESSVLIRSNNLQSGAAIKQSSGSIVVTAPEITLDRAKLKADAVFSGRASSTDDGGDIYIGTNNSGTATQTKLLLLRNGSLISTNADDSNLATVPNGGSININSALIVAIPSENSDITANARDGAGGKVNITAQGIYGIEFQPILTPNSDITVSSIFGRSGTVNIVTPGIDPGKNNTELPTVPTDASNQISQVCGASNSQNKLTVTGRGGLPTAATDLLSADALWQDDRANSPAVANNTPTAPVPVPPPAIGLVFDGNGKATLVAAKTDKKPLGTNVACPKTKQQ